MATVYSLICFGGLSGKTVTFTDAGDVVNLTNHGLRQGVTGVVFSTTGALPTGIIAGTTYYPRDGTDANKFTIYPTKADALAGTNQITFTGTGSGTHTVKSAYRLGLSSGLMTRYGADGDERIFHSTAEWYAARITAGVGAYDLEVLEIGEAYTDIISANIDLVLPCGGVLITTMVNGVRSGGWHGGVVGAGYHLQRQGASSAYGLRLNTYRTEIDGFTVKAQPGAGYSISGLNVYKAGTIAKNIIAIGPGNNYGTGITVYGPMARAINCRSINGWGTGCIAQQYASGIEIQNCLASGNNVGFAGSATSNIFGFWRNNISIGNNTNWGTMAGFEEADKNAGLATDTIPTTSGKTSIIIATTDFIDFASKDYRPASSSSPQVDTGVMPYGAITTDIADKPRPSYVNGSDVADVGPDEYDYGNGSAPIPATLTIAANVSLYGAEIRIYDADNTPAGTLGTELSGTESNTSTTYIYSAASLLNNTIYIQVMQSGYEEFLTSHTVANINETLTLTLKADVNA